MHHLTPLLRIAGLLGLAVKLAEPDRFWFEDRVISIGTPEPSDYKKRGGLELHVAWYLAHELGHFLVATKSRRFKQNYGIFDLTQEHQDLEEYKAFLIGLYLLNFTGYRFGAGFGLRTFDTDIQDTVALYLERALDHGRVEGEAREQAIMWLMEDAEEVRDIKLHIASLTNTINKENTTMSTKKYTKSQITKFHNAAVKAWETRRKNASLAAKKSTSTKSSKSKTSSKSSPKRSSRKSTTKR